MMRFGLIALTILQIVGYSMQGKILDGIIDLGGKGLDHGIKGVEKGLNGVKDGAEKVGDGIRDGIDAVGDGIKKGVDAVENGVQQGVNGVGDGIKNLVPDCLFGVDKIAFVLFTEKKYKKGIVIEANATTLPIEQHAKIRFLIHGFTSEANTTNYFDLANAWMKAEKGAHILSVQWKEGACTTGGLPLTDFLSYPKAVMNTREVGVMVANFTRRLMKEYDVSLAGTIIAGHSLGAHVSGFAGKEVQRLGLGKYKMIIGLDPAGPGFENSDCINRLCKTDANFVQILHTSYLAGIHRSLGHVDFYFNSVIRQPGCVIETCNHGRSAQYFTESLENSSCVFLGVPYVNDTRKTINKSECTPEICTRMGLETIDYPARGNFNVQTTSDPPYCMD